MKGFFKSEKTTEPAVASKTTDSTSKKPAVTSSYAKASQTLEEAQPKAIVLEGPMATLFSMCGNGQLFSKKAIKVINGVRDQLKSLLDMHPVEMMASEDMKRSRKSIALLAELLDKFCTKTNTSYPNNNLNFFISPSANAFYQSLGSTPTINDELTAKAAEIFLTALRSNDLTKEMFQGLGLRVGYSLYTKVEGDQIQIAANYLRAKLDVYVYARDNSEESALMQAVNAVKYHSRVACDFAREGENTHGKALRQFDNVITTMQKANFQFQADAPRGFAAVAAGAALRNLAQCQDEIVSRNVSKVSTAPVTFIHVDVPPAADDGKYNNLKSRIAHFDANLLKECERICAKPSSEEEGKVFNDLRVKMRDLQKSAAAPNIAMDLLERYTTVSNALKAHAIWNADPQANAFLKACAAEMKGMMGDYSLDLTAKELSDTEKTALHQPAATLQIAAEIAAEPDANEAKTLKM